VFIHTARIEEQAAAITSARLLQPAWPGRRTLAV